MRLIVYGGAAGIHAYEWRVQRLEHFLFTAQGVVNEQSVLME